VAADCTGNCELTLSDVFGEDTELVNIAKETTNGTITQRTREWVGRSSRHVYVGRGSIWGNPFSDSPHTAAQFVVKSREEAILKYREYIQSRPDLMARLSELKGKRLGCWCKPKSCHGDVLMELVYDI